MSVAAIRRRAPAAKAGPARPGRFWARAAGPLALLASIIVPLAAAALGGPIARYLDPASLLLVVLGTIAATLLGSAPRDLAGLPTTLADALGPWPSPADAEARRVVALALAVRREGGTAWAGALAGLGDAPGLQRAVEQARDGLPPERIAAQLAEERRSLAERRGASVAVLRRAAETAPAMGLIGTLLGLVQMLAQLSDPEAIGPAMALALLTTLYGALLAHAVVLPLAERIESRLAAELQVLRIQEAAAISIARRENPRLLEAALESLLPPGRRLGMFG